MNDREKLKDRFRGALLGLAVGDALGTPLEFKKPGSFEPINGMIGGGVWQLKPGQWTDDTSMALCLAESLIECKGFNPVDQLERYVKWYRTGYLSSTGSFFDIGSTVRKSLWEFLDTSKSYRENPDQMSAGNGSIMRLAPVPMFYFNEQVAAFEYAELSSKTTHSHADCIDACKFMAGLIIGALSGEEKQVLLSPYYSPVENYWQDNPIFTVIRGIADCCYKDRQPPQVKAKGYVFSTLEAALWAFYNSDNFRDGALMAVNLGDDADTVGAVFGQIAGAFYGAENIPDEWRKGTSHKELILDYADKLFELAVDN